MNIYIGQYWVPFPSSEYGGNWVVIAESEEQCVEMLKGGAWDDRHEDAIPEAVAKSRRFRLHGDHVSEVVETFYT